MEHAAIREQMRTLIINEVGPMLANGDIHNRRMMMDAMGAQAEMPAGLLVQNETIGGIACERLSPARRESRIILYVHGGGYALGSPNSHRGLAARLGVACRAHVVVPDYRLAPEHPFPAAHDDLFAVYEALVESVGADRIIVAGDSSGGGLAISTLLKAAQEGLPMPRALLVLSPWTDLTMSGLSLETRAEIDPVNQPETLAQMRDIYLDGDDPTNPFASPLWGDLSELPPMLIHVGDQEVLLSDSLRLAERAHAAGVSVELEVGEDLWHVWHFFAPMLPQANEAIARIGEFVERRFGMGAGLRQVCG